MKRYDICWVAFDPAVGAEMAKTQPAVVVSLDALNRRLQTVTVCPLTTALHPRWRTRLAVRSGGRVSEVAVDQIRTVARSRIGKRIGALTEAEATDSYFYALDARTGELKWKFKAGDDPVIHNQVGFQSSATVVNGVVYVGCRDGHVYALDAKTGALRFVLDGKRLIFGSVSLAGDLGVVGTFTGHLMGIDTRAGKIAWDFRTSGNRADTLHLLTADGAFRPSPPVFDNFLHMTVRLYQMFSVGAVIATPTVSHGVIFFGSTDGNLYAVN